MKVTGTAARYEELMFPAWRWGTPMILTAGCFDESIEAGPDVELVVHHTGWSLASTLATEDVALLALALHAEGLDYEGGIDPEQPDAVLAHRKVATGLLRQASFGAFITDGKWEQIDNEDVYRVLKCDLDEGDISIVRLGANANTSSVAEDGDVSAGIALPRPDWRIGRRFDFAGVARGPDNRHRRVAATRSGPSRLPDRKSKSKAELEAALKRGERIGFRAVAPSPIRAAPEAPGKGAAE